VDVMADDPYSRIAQLEAHLAASQEREAALAAEVEQRDRTLADAREEQRATADVLRVIAASPTDLQAIMQTIVDSVVRLCGGDFAFIDRIDGDDLVRVANVLNDLDPPWPVGQRLPPGSGGPAQRAIRQAVAEGRTVSWMREIDDVGPPGGRYFPRAGMAFPLSRETTTIGALVVSRGAREPFSDQQISLLEAFADQAVIAMENARLFQELDARNAELHESNRQVTDALEQQTATANVLRVIASSPTDVQLVLDTVAESALRLCGANQVAVYRLQEGLLRFAATGRPDTEGNSVRLGLRQGVLPSREFVAGRAVLDQRTVHVLDLQTDADFPLGQQMATASGHRTTLGVPLLSEGVAIGALSISHKTVRPFTEQQIALVESFADQSVIAIENARLFAELEQRNRELSEALEQQTATSEILRIIASTPADLRRVLESLAEHAARLCEAENVSILRVEDDVFVSAAMRGNLRTPTDEYTIPVSSGSVAGLAVVERRTVHIPYM
jgi:GAF domain-containing protein